MMHVEKLMGFPVKPFPYQELRELGEKICFATFSNFYHHKLQESAKVVEEAQGITGLTLYPKLVYANQNTMDSIVEYAIQSDGYLDLELPEVQELFSSLVILK